jgi:hypothetical protein
MTIYDLKGHEELSFEGKGLTTWYVLRVPGGWIYSAKTFCTFVPFSDELQKDSHGFRQETGDSQ